MTKEELELLKKLLDKAAKTLDKKEEDCFYKEGSLTELEDIYSILLEVAHLKLSLDLGFRDKYLIDDESQTKSLR